MPDVPEWGSFRRFRNKTEEPTGELGSFQGFRFTEVPKGPGLWYRKFMREWLESYETEEENDNA